MKVKLSQSSNHPDVTLQSLIDVNSGLNSILRTSYRVLAGKGPKQRIPELNIYVKDFKNGSVINDLAIEISNSPILSAAPAQLAFTLSNFNPTDVFTAAKNAIKFWKIFDKEKKEGHIVSLNVDQNSFVVVNTGSGNITIGDKTLEVASLITGAGEQMTRPVRNGSLESLNLTADNSSLLITAENGDCFDAALDIDPTVKEIIGDVIEFNKSNLTGTVVYIERHTIISKKFNLTNKSNAISAIDSMKTNRCKLFCHEEFIDSPNGRRNVFRLQCFKIEVL